MTIQNFIAKRPYLVWHTKKLNTLSEAAIVEAVLNYGDWDDVEKLIKILGLKKTADIFRAKSGQSRNNYRPEIKNYFQLYFNKYAPRSSHRRTN